MNARFRLVFCAALALASASACNAILGITDLSAGPADAGVDGPLGADSLVPLPDTFVPPPGSDAMAPCSATGDPDPCLISEPQTGGALFPTWAITSDQGINALNLTVIQPTRPVYSDAGAGAVVETHSKLTWRTAYGRDGGDVDHDGAIAACQALGTGWRLPTRIELATTQYRGAPLITGLRGVCTPPEFDQSQHAYAWTSTRAPAGTGDPMDAFFIGAEATCGFVSGPKTELEKVRCVKGDTKPATFIVSKSKDTVRAVDTGLVWERAGIVVRTLGEAKTHCDGLGARIPIIQELYGIIDTRTTALFHSPMFVRPADGGAQRAIISQTVFSIDSTDAAAPVNFYEAVAMINGPWANEDTTFFDDGQRDLLLRCVSTFVP